MKLILLLAGMSIGFSLGAMYAEERVMDECAWMLLKPIPQGEGK